jgi:hypothetical protein
VFIPGSHWSVHLPYFLIYKFTYSMTCYKNKFRCSAQPVWHLDCCNTMTLNYHVTIHYKLSYHYYGLLVSPLYSCTLCPFLIHLFMFNFFSPHSFLIQLSLFPNWQSHGLFQQQTTTNLIISCNILSVVEKNMALLLSKWEVSI